jgi:hypothetical protein
VVPCPPQTPRDTFAEPWEASARLSCRSLSRPLQVPGTARVPPPGRLLQLIFLFFFFSAMIVRFLTKRFIGDYEPNTG